MPFVAEIQYLEMFALNQDINIMIFVVLNEAINNQTRKYNAYCFHNERTKCEPSGTCIVVQVVLIFYIFQNVVLPPLSSTTSKLHQTANMLVILCYNVISYWRVFISNTPCPSFFFELRALHHAITNSEGNGQHSP